MLVSCARPPRIFFPRVHLHFDEKFCWFFAISGDQVVTEWSMPAAPGYYSVRIHATGTTTMFSGSATFAVDIVMALSPPPAPRRHQPLRHQHRSPFRLLRSLCPTTLLPVLCWRRYLSRRRTARHLRGSSRQPLQSSRHQATTSCLRGHCLLLTTAYGRARWRSR